VIYVPLRSARLARRHPVPVEAWLIALIVVSAIAGAVLALMGMGYLP
jgi:hypothetical protein